MQKPFKTTLSNGLRVILLENRTAPVISMNLWASVGSVNETDKEAGLCHLIEHMLFKGTSRRPVGQIAKEVEAAGGDMNAYTSFDETVFYINMSSRRLEVGLDILADACIDPTFDEEELRREKEVVVEEISRSEDNPSQMVSQDLFSKAFQVHPYRRPIAGDRETVRGVSREHLMGFYRRWYVASNLILIVVGDFETDTLLQQIEKLYSKIPAGTTPSQEIPEEPTQRQNRVAVRAMEVEGRYLDMAIPIPGLAHHDIPGLDLLSHILGGGTSSRLEQSVKEKKKLVASISSCAYSPRYPGLFIIGSVLKEKAVGETLQAVWEAMDQLKSSPPSTVEFARARESLRSVRVYERQTVEAMARKLGFFEGIAGGLSFEEDYYRRLSDVTPEDIQKLAQDYFRPERLTLAFCHPKTESWAPSLLSAPFSKPKKPKKPTLGKKGIQFFKLPNGARLLVKENHNLPLVALRSASLGGLRSESRKDNGIHHLLSLLVTKGTKNRLAREIAEESENLSGHVDSYTGKNLIGLYASFLSEKITEGTELFFDLLLHPSFPEDEIVKEKARTYTAIRNEDDSLSHIAMKKFLAALYPRHPYGLPFLGTASSVRSISRGDLLRAYKTSVKPKNLVFAVVGDVEAKEIHERFSQKLLLWERLGAKDRSKTGAPPQPRPPARPVTVETKKEKLQAHIVQGFLGTTVNHRDRYSLDVLNSILAGQGGRLFLELRDKQGLAYAISSSSHEGIEAGYFAVYMGTDPVKLKQAMKGITLELEKVRQELVLEEEIERAKQFLIGSYELDLQKNETVAALLAFNEIYGIGKEELFKFPEKVRAVTRQDILRVARKYLHPEAAVLSVVGQGEIRLSP